MRNEETRPTDRPTASGSITPPAPYFDQSGITLYRGEALEILPQLAGLQADALVTDPPYSSGGTTTAERARDPAVKYCQDKNALGRPTFGGDMRDQRSFVLWSALWLIQARRLLVPSAYALVFSDWRQVPTMSDAIQAADLVWRGLIAWDKGRGARAPHKGFFKHQCEYVIWATHGKVPRRTDAGPFDGCIKEPVRQADKFHMTGKPTPVLQELLRCVPAGGLVLDPFAGSGTTGVAAALTGRRCVLIERETAYCDITVRRLETALARRAA